jgi:hypothetical protein
MCFREVTGIQPNRQARIGITTHSRDGSIEIWSVVESWGTDYYVYGVTVGGDPIVCPSIGMAHEVAARGRAQPQTVELTKIIIEFESPPPK